MSKVEKSGSKPLQNLMKWLGVIACVIIVAGCTSNLPAPPTRVSQTLYHIGAGDALNIFVWQNSDLSTKATVRPDGMISLPLIHDIRAAGKTPTQLAYDIQSRLRKYVTNPVVSVMVDSALGQFSEQIRVIGEAAKPMAIPYRKGMTALDAMIAVGGLTPFAAGDRATLVRTMRGGQKDYRLHLNKLLNDGDMSANVPLKPGDVIVIPQTYF